MHRNASMVSLALAFITVSPAAFAKTFVQFECRRGTSSIALIDGSNIDTADAAARTAILNAGSCARALDALFALHYKLTKAISRPISITGSQSSTEETGIVYILEK